LLAAPQAPWIYVESVETNTERVDRYVVAAGVFRFWWVVAGLGTAATGWLLWSIAASLS